MLTASNIYRAAARLKPETTCIVSAPTYCAMCAAPLAAGDRANKVTKNTFDNSFNNKWDLRAPSGTHVCGDCIALWGRDWMQKYSKTFACEQGVFKFASNDQQAAMLLNPPATPFAAIVSTKQQQHMIWRTPVSLSRDFFMVRVDGDVLTIRHAILMDALRIYKFAEKVMTDTVPAGRKKSLKGPAALFDRELQSSKMGMLRPDVDASMRETGNAAAIDQLHNLSMGEWWALNVIRHYDPAQPPPWQNALLAVDAAA